MSAQVYSYQRFSSPLQGQGTSLKRQTDMQSKLLLCKYLGITFHSGMLEWEHGKIREWSSEEENTQKKWHKTLESSQKILPPEEKLPKVEISRHHQYIYDRALDIYIELTN